MNFIPEKDYEGLLKQAKAMHRIIEAMEKSKSIQGKAVDDLTRQLLICGKDNLESERETNAILSDQVLQLEKERDELREELTLSTDQNDLLLDEFIRVKLLTDNEEIHGLCERAHVRMRQKVSVIARNMAQEEKIISLRRDIRELEKERDELKAAVALAIRTFDLYEMDVDTYPTTEHIRMMDELKGVLVEHNIAVIDGARLYVADSVSPDDSAEDYDLCLLSYTHILRQKSKEVGNAATKVDGS